MNPGRGHCIGRFASVNGRKQPTARVGPTLGSAGSSPGLTTLRAPERGWHRTASRFDNQLAPAARNGGLQPGTSKKAGRVSNDLGGDDITMDVVPTTREMPRKREQ